MIWQVIATVEAKPTTKALMHIRARLEKGECIGCKTEPGKAKRRGLCDDCYDAWRNCRLELATPEAQASFDAKLIRIGRLLASQGIRAFRASRNLFKQVASEVKS